MPPVSVVRSAGQLRIAVERVTPKHSRLVLGSHRSIHFWDEIPVAVVSGEVIWHRGDPSGALTKMLDEIEPKNAPRINCSASEFDFTLGQALTLTGLPLTRLQDESK